jgi:hypothetical protein
VGAAAATAPGAETFPTPFDCSENCSDYLHTWGCLGVQARVPSQWKQSDTHRGKEWSVILSPSRLPFRHPG